MRYSGLNAGVMTEVPAAGRIGLLPGPRANALLRAMDSGRSGPEMELSKATAHVPVMLQETLRLLDPHPGESFCDGTAGAGGHSEAILRAIGETGRLIAIDRDSEMAQVASDRLAQVSPNASVVVANFSEMDRVLAESAVDGADGILLDLGVASPHFDQAARGFSYREDGPLDMRMDAEGPTAEEWINSAPEEEIANVIFQYGEERRSRRIARHIVTARSRARIRRTVELAEIIRRATPPGPRRLHPARRSFQGIRIFLNRELEHLEAFLAKLPKLLHGGGRCVIISYHSLEDRLVKNAFRSGARDGIYELLERKPLRPSNEEIESNPRSRSAKLRGIRRTAGGDAL